MQEPDPAINLDYPVDRAITTAMSHGQSFVGLSLSYWDMLRGLFLTLLLLVGACSSPLEKAREEAALAEQLARAGNFPAARQAMARALSHRDDQIDILQLDAAIKYQMGDFIGAYDSYRVILAIDPNNLQALVGVAQLGTATGNVREARSAIDTALAIDPRQSEVLVSKAILALTRKNYDEAIEVGERLSEIQPGAPIGLVVQARGKFLRGEQAESMEMLNTAATELGNNRLIATALLENARTLRDEGIMLEQLGYLRRENPNSVDLTVDEANVRYKSGQAERARTVVMQGLERFGEDERAISRLVDLWREYDDNPLSPSDIARLSRDGELDVRLIVGRYLLNQGNLDGAKQLVEGIGDSRAAGLRAWIGVRAGRPGAADEAEEILEEDDGNCEALLALADARIAEGQPTGAIRAAQVVSTSCLDRTDGYLTLARAYGLAGRSEGIERVYREGIDTHPMDRELVENFANWLLQRGRDASALSAARRLTKAVPAKVSTWTLYESVCERAGDQNCAAEAREMAEEARRNFAMDLLPGVRPVNPLLGQSWR